MNTTATFFLAAWCLTATGSGSGPQRPPGDAVVQPCLLSVKQEVPLPAQEAGVIVELSVQEGMRVTKGQLLGRVDDRQAILDHQLAANEHRSAKEQAENDIDVRYAEAAARVAEQEYQNALDANRKVRGTFPPSEMRRLRLAVEESVLEIEQAKFRQRIAEFTTQSRAAEVEVADANIARRRLVAPIDGDIVAVFRQHGQWVQPGDPVARLVNLGTLRVEGFLSAKEYDANDVADRPVSVEVELARGRSVRVQGKIVYVSPIVQAGGQYRVWAEVQNEQESGQWLLRPGLTAKMTIDVD